MVLLAIASGRSAFEASVDARAKVLRYALVSFDPGSIVASMLVSGVGYVLFSYGKKRGRPPHLATGILMLVYPYFVPSVPWMLGIGATMLALLGAVVRLGL